MSSFRNDGFATSSHDVKGLKAAKEDLYAKGFPLAEARDLVARFFDPTKFSHLRAISSERLVYAVAPSTSGENILPRLFAAELKAAYGGTILSDWSRPLAVERAARKGAIGKIREPARFEPVPDRFRPLPSDAFIVLVDDVVTTGQSLAGMRDALRKVGFQASEVVSLAQSELRRVTAADITRLTSKLGQDVGSEISTVLNSYALKHFANYIERITPHESQDNPASIRVRSELREFFRAEAGRLRELGITLPLTNHGASIGAGRTEGVQPRERTEAANLSDRPGETRGIRGSSHAAKNESPLTMIAEKKDTELRYELQPGERVGLAKVALLQDGQRLLLDEGKAFAIAATEQRPLIDALLRTQEQLGNQLPYPRETLVAHLADRVQFGTLLEKGLKPSDLRRIVESTASAIKAEIDRLPDHQIAPKAERTPEARNAAALLETLDSLKTKHDLESGSDGKRRIIDEADKIARDFSKANTLTTSASVELRRAAQGFVAGKIAGIEMQRAVQRSQIAAGRLEEQQGARIAAKL